MATGMIGQVNIGDDSYLIGSTLFAIFDTNNGGTISSVTINNQNYTQYYVPFSGFVNAKGLTIHILFKEANTTNASNIALKIGNSDALVVQNPNGAKTWAADSVISFTNDGNNNWIMNSTQIDISNITIDVSQLNNLTLGNINSDGTITNHASQAVVTDSTAKIIAKSLSTEDPTANGNALSFIDTIRQDAQGQITATKKTVQSAGRNQLGVIQLPSGNTTTKFLREDGSWEEPAYTVNTDTKLRVYLATNSTGVELPLVGLNSGNATAVYATHTSGTKDVYGAIPNTPTNRATINSKTGAITVPGGIIGNASTATNFLEAKNITLTGDITGNANGGASSGWSISTTIGEGKVTNAMLVNHTIQIGSTTKNLGEAFSLEDIGLSRALKFIGTTSTEMTDGRTTAAIRLTGADSDTTPTVGDVVIDNNSDSEYVWTGSIWERLGRDSSWALQDEIIPKSLLTAAGDIIIGTTSGANIIPTKLEKGTDGQVLTIDSSTHLPKWLNNAATDANVTQTGISIDAAYSILLKNTTGTTNETAGVNYVNTTGNLVTINPSSGTIFATAFSGDGSNLTNVTASSVDWQNVTSKVTASTNTLGLVQTTSTVSDITDYTAAPIVNGVVYYKDTDTHTARLFKRTDRNATASHVVTTNTNTFLNLVENNTLKDSIQIKGDAGIIVTGTGTAYNTSVITIKHSNTISPAKDIAAQSAKTLTWDDTFTLYEELYDTEGHITGTSNYNMTMPSNPVTSTAIKTQLGTDNNATGLIFLHKTGTWKTLNSSIASVNNGILTIAENLTIAT